MMCTTCTTVHRYEGNWSNDRREGHGSYFYASGAVYRGSWERGRMHGMGLYTSASGSRYEGMYRSDRDGFLPTTHLESYLDECWMYVCTPSTSKYIVSSHPVFFLSVSAPPYPTPPLPTPFLRHPPPPKKIIIIKQVWRAMWTRRDGVQRRPDVRGGLGRRRPQRVRQVHLAGRHAIRGALRQGQEARGGDAPTGRRASHGPALGKRQACGGAAAAAAPIITTTATTSGGGSAGSGGSGGEAEARLVGRRATRQLGSEMRRGVGGVRVEWVKNGRTAVSFFSLIGS